MLMCLPLIIMTNNFFSILKLSINDGLSLVWSVFTILDECLVYRKNKSDQPNRSGCI